MCIWCAACEGGSSEGWLLYKQDWARSRTKHARAGTSPSRISSWQYVSQVSRAGLNPVSRVSLGARSPVKYVAVERAQGPARELISKGSEPGISQGARVRKQNWYMVTGMAATQLKGQRASAEVLPWEGVVDVFLGSFFSSFYSGWVFSSLTRALTKLILSSDNSTPKKIHDLYIQIV